MFRCKSNILVMGKRSGKKRRNLAGSSNVEIPGLGKPNESNKTKKKSKKRRKDKVKPSSLPILDVQGTVNFEYGGDRTEQRLIFSKH